MTLAQITGNKGEWSEVYVFLKLLGQGYLSGSEEAGLHYNINKIVRNEDGNEYQYVLTPDGDNAQVKLDDEIILEVSRKEIEEQAEELLDQIRSSRGSFAVESVEQFMTRIKCHKLKAPSNDKSDITIEIHDHRSGLNPLLGFSIKSMLGSPSTLVNASKATNFDFLLHGDEEYIREKQSEINGKIKNKIRRNLNSDFQDLVDHGIQFEFIGADNRALRSNIRFLDGDLPTIVSEMLKLYYIEGVNKVSEQVEIIKRRNPLHFDRPDLSPLYESKVKRLLSAYALGMQSSTLWDGKEEASGGFIIVRRNGDILCYHLYNRNDFENYLFYNTVFDTASTARHEFSTIESCIDGSFMVKLNLQIRFFDSE